MNYICALERVEQQHYSTKEEYLNISPLRKSSVERKLPFRTLFALCRFL